MTACRDVKWSAGFLVMAAAIDGRSGYPSFFATARISPSIRATSFKPSSWISSAVRLVVVDVLMWKAYRS